jgi:uncharacterized ion transporter superfamily protein YfcC
MVTLESAVIVIIVVVMIAVILTYLICNYYYGHSTQALNDELENYKAREANGEMPVTLMTVTLHDAVSNEFVETKRFTDVVDALNFVRVQTPNYTVVIKAYNSRARQSTLTLVNIQPEA